MHTNLFDLFRNTAFWSAVLAWFTAQTTKMVCGMQRTGRVDFQYMVSLGGMPSAHSAMASALATAIGMSVGFGHPLFVATLAFALTIMFDAATVRRAAGHQARLLNEMTQELFQKHKFSERKLAELLGHTRFEVFMGMVIGVLVGLLVSSIATLRGSPAA